ncbi:MAG: C40 family peptidase [Ignavibacteriaceae bacterium]|nr:C40 family peptidase [Ignavibacteriaceae bacterium]
MTFKYLYYFLFTITLLITGCTASSGSGRYQKETENINEVKDVRFTTQDDPVPSNKAIQTDSSQFGQVYDETDPDDFPEEEPTVDISEILNKFSTSGSGTVLDADNSTLKEKLLMEIIEYLNTPYKYGGHSKKGIDCSAFTQTVYSEVLSTSLLRSARDQYTQGNVISSKADLLFGDLIFFNTRRRVKPGHVGIYIGDNLFAHASSKHGVIISSLDLDYYSKRFMGGRRLDDAQF